MNDWREHTLGEISTFRKGINYSSSDYTDEDSGQPFITIKCVRKGGGYSPRGLKYFDGTYTSKDLLSEGDVIFSITDLTRAADIVGSPIKVPAFETGKLALASMDMMRLEPIPEICCKNFIYHRLMLDDVRSKMANYSAGSTVLHLETKKINEIAFSLPPLPQQQKIALILTTVDNLIEQTQALIDKYTAIKQGMMADLFTRGIDLSGTPETNNNYGQLRPSVEQAPELYKETELGWVPKQWEVVQQSKLISLMTNGFVGVATPHYTGDENGVQYLYGNNIRANKIELDRVIFVNQSFHQKLKKSQLRAGDMLTVQSGHIGTSAVVPENFGEANCHALIITRFLASRVDSRYISYYCNSLIGMNRMEEIFVGSTIKHVNVKEFKGFLIPLSSKEEQKNIIKKIVAIEKSIESEEKSLSKLTKSKKGLMQDLLTGKVQVDA